MSGPIYDITISRIGDVNPVYVEANGIQCTWTKSEPGSLSAEVPTETLWALGIAADPRGLWLRYEHPLLPVWEGEIGAYRHSLESGVTELAASTFDTLLEARRPAKTYDRQSAQPGAIVKRAIIDAGRTSTTTWITAVEADESGQPIPLRTRGTNILDVIRQITDAGHLEYRMKPGRILEARAHLGDDLTDSVQLVWGVDVVGGDYVGDIRPLVNDLLAVPGDNEYERSGSVVVRDTASIQAHGVRQDTRTFDGFVTKTSLRPVAERQLAILVKQGLVATLALSNEGGCFGRFDVGDTVSLLLPTIGVLTDFRIGPISYDTEDDLLTVTGGIV